MSEHCDTSDIPRYVKMSTSWNPWHGCHRVSEGCRNCYMFLGDEKRGILESDTVRRSKTQFDLPLRKNRNGGYVLRDKLVLTTMTGDFFIEEADEWRDDAWEIIRKRSDLTFEILTKRPHRMADHLPDDWGDGYPNVRLSVSAEDQKNWDERVSALIEIPSLKKDIFVAPMIGKIDAEPLLSKGKIDCVFLGGEYGGRSRPCDMDWVKAVRASCIRNNVSLFWRNCGELLIVDGDLIRFPSLQDQGVFCKSHNLDYIVDDPIPKQKQSTLFRIIAAPEFPQ